MTTARLQCIVWCGLLSVLSCFLPPQEAQADLITYKFEGSVTSMFGPAFEPPSPVSLGETLTVFLKYETNTPDTVPLEPAFGQYFGAIDSLSFTLGNQSGSLGTAAIFSGASSFIQIDNNLSGTDVVIMGASLMGSEINGLPPTALSIFLVDSTEGAFDSKALGTIPSISAFGGSGNVENFFQLVYSNSAVSGGFISATPVPLPPAVILFGAGLVALVGLGAGRWRQKGNNLA